jgi:hypothetical protein
MDAWTIGGTVVSVITLGVILLFRKQDNTKEIEKDFFNVGVNLINSEVGTLAEEARRVMQKGIPEARVRELLQKAAVASGHYSHAQSEARVNVVFQLVNRN